MIIFISDFECILDKNKKPLPHTEQIVVMADLKGMHWEQDGLLLGRKGLPPGAQRWLHIFCVLLWSIVLLLSYCFMPSTNSGKTDLSHCTYLTPLDPKE